MAHSFAPNQVWKAPPPHTLDIGRFQFLEISWNQELYS